MATKLKLNLQRVSDPSWFHDSRGDARLLAKCINEVVKKLNEVIDENEQMKQEIADLKSGKPN